MPLENAAMAAEIARLGPWFHNLTLGGLATAPDHFLGDFPRSFFERFADAIPADLGGWSVLDVGCNAGFYAFEMQRRGAARVLGIDTDRRYLQQARFAARTLGRDVAFEERSVYDVAGCGGPFDLVLFLGVLYHLRHPLLALDLLRRFAVGRLLVFQSMLRGDARLLRPAADYAFADRRPFDRPEFPKLHFIEDRYAGDDTNWWVPNASCAAAMLRSAGFEIIARPDEEVFVCRPAPVIEAPAVPGAFEETSRA